MLKCFYILTWITVFKLCFSQPRMELGNESVLGKKYLVYFIKSPYSNADDDTWLCAGAIVTPTQILTAAACLVEMNNIYVIAGYKKYVHARELEKDKCANTWKKKVVKVSVPEEYTTSTKNQLEWMNVDIGVATVKEPYDFNDQSYLTYCSYVPGSIMINYDKENELENTRAIALGWGGKTVKGELAEEKLKPKLLQEATTTIIEKKYCANLVPKNGSKELVEKYLLCASGNGFLGEDDEEATLNPILEEPIRKIFLLKNDTKNINQSNEMSSRKSSLVETCQNDHGGPLITWVGTQEVVLGVALNGICNPNFDCVGPRIYVSTVATEKIIKCLLETNDTRRKICNDQIGDKRYQVNDIEINWPELLKGNLTSSLSIQRTPSFRRQNNNEEPLLVRPTKDLRFYDEQERDQDNPLQNSQDHLQESLKENSQKSRTGDPREYPRELPHENLQENPQEQLQENPYKNRQPSLQENRELNPYYQQQNPSQAKTQPLQQYMNQQQIELQKQPEMDTINQAQMESYNQPPLNSYYNQPPMGSFYNQPPMELKKTPKLESYNQPQTESPSVQQNNQNLRDPNSQLQMDIINKQHMALQNQPQRQINKDESKTNQRQVDNNSQIPTIKPPQMDSYMPLQDQSYNQPQVEFKKPHTELQSLKLLQPKVGPLSQIPYSNKELPSPYMNHKQIEPFKPDPVESYNPLDIIMSENRPDEDVSFKRPMEEPYKPPPVEPHKQPSVNSYMPPPFKPKLNKPYEQPHLSQNYQPYLPNYVQPLGQPLQQTTVQPSDISHVANSLRNRPPPALNPSQDEAQTFEQMFSQLHAGPEPSAVAPPPPEETFEELYRHLHEEEVEEPHEFDKQIAEEAVQTDAKMMSVPPAFEEQNDEVQVRQQMPLEYPDYMLKSRKRRNT